MAEYEVNDVINGLYGFVYDENGQELSTTQEFEAGIDFEKQEIKQAGKFLTSHKVTGGTGKGSINQLKVDSRLVSKIAADPTGKYTYIGKLADPTARGEEAIMFSGLSFDSAPLIGWKLGDLVEMDVDFTFDNFRYLTSIG
ncbi:MULTISPECIES: phage tail tube protein [Pelosinus]|uniref:XkdM protein, phage-like element PBSX n=1 Tax=Pelosinus fermentans B4 TaxID=1149862 RepID=I9B464_9FIRM|nr:MULTISPECIES: phage tail tube protein [Pelosinus]EIW19912.1 XkdM protein, phage-like element PBSX [Pelosinus fermentans B4]EIW21231.1 XkdM protein, phage-like element PBSX [Pelosinus fermentans A11]